MTGVRPRSDPRRRSVAALTPVARPPTVPARRDSMSHPRAGQPAEASDLVNVPRLLAAYYTERPDPAARSQRVAFGTSGHRGSSLRGSFNEAHILATTQAICDYRTA